MDNFSPVGLSETLYKSCWSFNPVQLVRKSYLKRAASAAALRGPPAAVGFPPSLWPLFTPPTSMGVSSSSSSVYLAPLSEWPLDLVQSSASASWFNCHTHQPTWWVTFWHNLTKENGSSFPRHKSCSLKKENLVIDWPVYPRNGISHHAHHEPCVPAQTIHAPIHSTARVINPDNKLLNATPSKRDTSYVGWSGILARVTMFSWCFRTSENPADHQCADAERSPPLGSGTTYRTMCKGSFCRTHNGEPQTHLSTTRNFQLNVLKNIFNCSVADSIPC